MAKPRVVITREQIRVKVAELADRIREDYRDRNPLLIGALKGSFIFMSDLVRTLGIPLTVDFISVSSYGPGKQSSGKIELVQDLKHPAEGRHILVIEDIVDTGLTLHFIVNTLISKRPASLRVCSLLDKPSRREHQVAIDYLGFTVPNDFIVGYGLDFDEQFRYLPDICVLEEE